MRSWLVAIALLGAGLAAVLAASALDAGTQRMPPKAPVAIQKIKHVVVIMQENRSFDQLLRDVSRRPTGSRRRAASRRACIPDPKTGKCDKPFVDHADVNGGGPHSHEQRDRRHQRRQDGRLRRPGRATRRRGMRGPDEPDCSQPHQHARRDGLPHPRRHPELLVVRRATSCSRTTCSSRTRRGACPSTSSRCRSGRRICTQHDNPWSCPNALQTPGMPPDFGRRRANGSRDRIPSTRGPT